jgi:hypothetical protein
LRPAEETGALVRQWAPYVRWNFLSHFSGDPGPTAEGRLIATGGCEVGMKEYPAGGWLSLPQLESRILNPPDFLDLPTYREVHTHMPAFAFRMLPMQWGAMSRIALDFWPGKSGPGNGSWFSHTEHLSAPGPDGAVPTVRFQMLREGAQEHEIRAALVRAYGKLPAERREPYRTLMEEFMRRAAFGAAYLPLMEMSFDWPAYAARLHAAAAELAGEKMEAEW